MTFITIGFAPEPYRGLADRFDDVEHAFPFLVAQHVAEQAAEQADVFLQRGVFIDGRGVFLGRC